MRLNRAILLAAVTAAARGAGAETAVSREPCIEEIDRARSAIDSLAVRRDGSGSPEDAALSIELGKVLGEVAGIAAGEGEPSRAARDLLARAASRRERHVAIEAVFVMIGLERDDALRSLLAAFPGMDLAVRRRAADYLLASRRGLGGVAGEAGRALAVEPDAETAAALVRALAAARTVDALRGILESAPPPPGPSDRGGAFRIAGSRAEDRIRAAMVEALAGQDPDELDWVATAAYEEAARDAGSAPGRIWLLARVAGSRALEAARPALEEHALDAREEVAVEALLALLRIGAEPSRRSIEAAARSRWPAVASSAAVVLGSIDRKAGVEALLELAASDAWEARSRAATGLAELSADHAALLRLLGLLEDVNREVRRSAFAALPHVGRKEVVPAVIALLAPLRGRDPELARTYLVWAAGRDLGPAAGAWRAWWESARSEYRFPLVPPPERRG